MITPKSIVGSLQILAPWPQDFEEVWENVTLSTKITDLMNLFCLHKWLFYSNLHKKRKKKFTPIKDENSCKLKESEFYCNTMLFLFCSSLINMHVGISPLISNLFLHIFLSISLVWTNWSPDTLIVIRDRCVRMHSCSTFFSDNHSGINCIRLTV